MTRKKLKRRPRVKSIDERLVEHYKIKFNIDTQKAWEKIQQKWEHTSKEYWNTQGLQ